MFHVSGFLDGQTWSVAREIFATIRHENQQQHRKRGHDELAGRHERNGHEGCLQDGPADLVDDVGQDALVDRPPLLNQGYDVRQSRIGQHDTRGALGDIGRAADGDADLGLAQCGRVIDAVTGHAGHVPCGLQVLHHHIFVFRKNLRETVGSRQQVHRLVADLGACGLQIRHAPDIGQPHAARNFARDGQRVAGEHLHRHAKIVEFGDELLGVRPGRDRTT